MLFQSVKITSNSIGCCFDRQKCQIGKMMDERRCLSRLPCFHFFNCQHSQIFLFNFPQRNKNNSKSAKKNAQNFSSLKSIHRLKLFSKVPFQIVKSKSNLKKKLDKKNYSSIFLLCYVLPNIPFTYISFLTMLNFFQRC